MALLGILISLATPSYRTFMMRAHRTEAIGRLLQVASCQERVYAAGGAYDTALCLPPGNEYYLFGYSSPGDARAMEYTVSARPVGNQAGDPCGSLLLDYLGLREISDASGDAGRCWSGR